MMFFCVVSHYWSQKANFKDFFFTITSKINFSKINKITQNCFKICICESQYLNHENLYVFQFQFSTKCTFTYICIDTETHNTDVIYNI